MVSWTWDRIGSLGCWDAEGGAGRGGSVGVDE